MIGLASVLYKSDAPVSTYEEQALVLAYAYGLAYQDHLGSSIGRRISRVLHISKPRRVTVIARVAYELKIVPFSATEVFISDSCSSCTEDVEVAEIDSELFTDSGRDLLPSAKSDEEQIKFLSQLKTVNLVARGFKSVGYKSPFLTKSNTLVRDIIGFLNSPMLPDGANSLIAPEFEIANHPEEIRDVLSNFLRNSNAYAGSLATTKNLVEERSRVMAALLNERYPTKEEPFFGTSVNFAWTPPALSRDRLVLLKPARTLVDALKTEVKPEVEAIERQNDIEKGKLEQKSELERRELERTYDTQIENAEKDKGLEIKRLDLERRSYEKQLGLVDAQHNIAMKALKDTREEFDRLTEAESEITAARLTEKISGLRRDMNELAERRSTIAQTLESVENELDITEDRHDKKIGGLQEAKTEALKDHQTKLKIQTDALEELKRRGMSDQLSHVTDVEKDITALEELIRMSAPEVPSTTGTTEVFELPDIWSDRALLDREIEAIDSLSSSIAERVDRASKIMDQTRAFIQSHLVRLNKPVSPTTVDVVLPFWYIEIESDSKSSQSLETYVIPPSNLVQDQTGSKQRLLGVDFIPLKPSISSAIESIRGCNNVRVCGRSNNQINQMNPSTLLSLDTEVMRRQLVSEDLLKVIQSDFNRRSKAKSES